MAREATTVPVEQRVFARNFKLVRTYLKLTQIAMSERCHHGQNFISGVERASVGLTTNTLTSLSHAIKTPLYLLFYPEFQSIYAFEKSTEIWEVYLKKLSNKASSERELLGDNLKAARRNANLNQLIVSELSGVTSETICYIERGDNGITIVTASKLASAIGVPLRKLLDPDFIPHSLIK